ncbi:MAG TPA: hypothetical protein VLF40_00225 [Candidatus Saccharimonadales bacterium]|nr:hypothetical protein [Candidatus Saccharimonadales bacterium]
MEDDPSSGNTAVRPSDVSAPIGGALDADTLEAVQQQGSLAPQPVTVVMPRRPIWPLLRWIGVGIVLVVLAVASVVLHIHRDHAKAALETGNFGTVKVSLATLKQPPAGTADTLEVNGNLQVSQSLVLTPTGQPGKANAGQIYFDKTSNHLAFYDGTQFVDVGTGTTNITNILLGQGNGVQLQGSSPGSQQTGNFNVSGTGMVGSLNTSIITSGGSTLYINPVSISTAATPSGVPITLGLTTAGGSTESGPGWKDGMNAQKITVGPEGGKLSSASVMYIGGSTSSHVQFALYEDDGDVPSKPGGRLAASAIVSMTPDGWTTASLPAITLDPNTTYWLAVNTDDATVIRTVNGGAQNYCYVFKPFGFMPDPFSAPGCFMGDLTYPLYLTYLTQGSSGGSISQSQITIAPDGSTLLRNSDDSSNAFQVQNAAGSNTIFNIDTINQRIAIGKTTASYKLDIAGGDINLTNGHSIRFGGSPVLTVTSGAVTALTNFIPGGVTRIQGDTFSVTDRNATHANLSIDDNHGNVTFSNFIDSTTAFQIQNSAGTTTILNADTTNSVITIANLAVSGHIITSGTAPGIAAGAAACTTPTVSVDGNDVSGTITVTTGTGCATSGTLAAVTFVTAFSATPHITLTPGSSTALALGAYINNSTATTTSFTIGTNSTPANSTTYEWNYLVVQ